MRFEGGKDLAVLKLRSPFALNAEVQPIDSAFTGMDGRLEREGTPVTVAGFGATRTGGGASTQLLEVTLPITNRRAAGAACGIQLRPDLLPAGGGGQDTQEYESNRMLPI